MTQPSSAVACTSSLSSSVFTIVAGGTPPFNYSWRKNSAPIDATLNPSAATATLTLTTVQPSDAGQYDCVVTNACGTFTTDPASLDVYANCIANPPLAITAGVPDAFSTDNGLEVGTPRPEFAAHLAQRLPGRDLLQFDSDSRNEVEYNRFVAHSFTGLPGDIISATISTRVRAGGTNAASNEGTDSVSIGHSFSATDFRGYKRFFGNENSPFLFDFPWRRYTASPESNQSFTTSPLDAAIIARMNALGYLDFLVEDDTAVDYVTLNAIRSVSTGADTVAWAGPISGSAESACLGQPFTMTVAAGGTGRTYQWYRFGEPIPLASNPTAKSQSLVIPNFQASDGGLYTCVVSNTFQTQTSPPFIPVLNGPSCTPPDCSAPTITAQPPDRSACAGQTPTFATAATSTAPGAIRYQWRQDGVPINPALNPSASTATLSVPVTSSLQAGVYDCLITTGSGCGVGFTRAATLSVGGPACTPACVPPVVTAQPAGITVCPGEPATLTVTASGTGTVTYRWRKDGVLISTVSNPSAATASLRIASALSGDRGSYTCSVSDGGGCAPVTSAAAVLRVGGQSCGVYAWDSADFNRDGVRNAADLVSYDALLAGQACTGCGDPDVNNDGVVDANDRVALQQMGNEGSTGGGGNFSPSTYALSPAGLASPPDTVPCESWNGGTMEFEYHPPGGIDQDISFPVSVNISNCLESNSVSLFGVEVKQALKAGFSTAFLSGEWDEYSAIQDAVDQIGSRLSSGQWSWDGNITIDPCIIDSRPLGRVRGSLSSYMFNIGNGGYTSVRMATSFRACDTMFVTVDHPVTLEIPLHVQGLIVVSESFGDSSTTEAKGELSIRGSIGGSSIPQMKIEAESVSAPAIVKSIDQSRAFTMSFATGTTSLPIDITGYAILETTAKASAFSGLIAGAATGSVDFPDTVEVGMVRGQNNTTLPPGVLIVSQRTGAVLADTRMNTCGPQIVEQPANSMTCQGGTVSLTVAVNTLSPATFIWTRNDVPIGLSENPTAASATLTIPNVRPDLIGSYRCVVRNGCGSVTTSPATLSICAADLVCDGQRNTPDLVFFLARFGQAATPGSLAERADFNHDGVVNTPDLVFFLGRFGRPCP